MLWSLNIIPLHYYRYHTKNFFFFSCKWLRPTKYIGRYNRSLKMSYGACYDLNFIRLLWERTHCNHNMRKHLKSIYPWVIFWKYIFFISSLFWWNSFHCTFFSTSEVSSVLDGDLNLNHLASLLWQDPWFWPISIKSHTNVHFIEFLKFEQI